LCGDALVIDLPPGTADVQQQLTRLLKVAGALVVVTPQDAAHLDARKVLTMLDQLSVPVIGGVENMSRLVCPTCATAIDVFPPVAPGERSGTWESSASPEYRSIPRSPAPTALRCWRRNRTRRRPNSF
jgi:ATP-binding protein involved in chromosome partitioning